MAKLICRLNVEILQAIQLGETKRIARVKGDLSRRKKYVAKMRNLGLP